MNDPHHMTAEDWAIWSRFHRRHRMDCQRADADDFSLMRANLTHRCPLAECDMSNAFLAPATMGGD